MNNQALQTLLSTAVKAGLTALGGYLIGQGWTDTGHWQDAVAAIAPILAAALYGLWDRLQLVVQREISKSLQNATQANVKAEAKTLSFSQKVTMAANPQ
jgi:hypothetical protein